MSTVLGTGSAPDSDEDAIIGMIIVPEAVKTDPSKSSFLDEVYDWANRS